MRYKKVAIWVGLILILGIGIYFSMMQTRKRKLTLSDFEFLEPGTSLDEVVAKVGEPDKNVGSGIYHPQYNLVDGGIMGLTFLDGITLDIAVYYSPRGDTVVLVDRLE